MSSIETKKIHKQLEIGLQRGLETLRKQLRRLKSATEKIGRIGRKDRSFDLSPCESPRYRRECCVCIVRDTIYTAETLMKRIEDVLAGEMAGDKFGMDLSMVPAECSSRAFNMLGLTAELNAIICLHERFGYDFEGWVHRSKHSSYLFGLNDAMNLRLPTQKVSGIPLGHVISGWTTASAQEVDVICARWTLRRTESNTVPNNTIVASTCGSTKISSAASEEESIPVSLWCEVKAFEIADAHFVDAEGGTEIGRTLEKLIAQLRSYRRAADRWHVEQLKKLYFYLCTSHIESIALKPLGSDIPGYVLASQGWMLSALKAWRVPSATNFEIERATKEGFVSDLFKRIQKSLTSIDWYRAVSIMRPQVACVLRDASEEVSDELCEAGFGVILSTRSKDQFDRPPPQLRWKLHSDTRGSIDKTVLNIDVSSICLFVTSLFDLTDFARSNKFLTRTAPSWISSTTGLSHYQGEMDGATTQEHQDLCMRFRNILGKFALVACESVVRAFEDYLERFGTPCEKRRWDTVKNKTITVIPDIELEFDYTRVVTQRSPDGLGEAHHVAMLDTGFSRSILTATSQAWAAELGAMIVCECYLVHAYDLLNVIYKNRDVGIARRRQCSSADLMTKDIALRGWKRVTATCVGCKREDAAYIDTFRDPTKKRHIRSAILVTRENIFSKKSFRFFAGELEAGDELKIEQDYFLDMMNRCHVCRVRYHEDLRKERRACFVTSRWRAVKGSILKRYRIMRHLMLLEVVRRRDVTLEKLIDEVVNHHCPQETSDLTNSKRLSKDTSTTASRANPRLQSRMLARTIDATKKLQKKKLKKTSPSKFLGLFKSPHDVHKYFEIVSKFRSENATAFESMRRAHESYTRRKQKELEAEAAVSAVDATSLVGIFGGSADDGAW